jgi:hypothetical protein
MQPQHWKPVRLVKDARAHVEKLFDVFAYHLVGGIANQIDQRLVDELDQTVVGKGEESTRRGVE